MKTHTQNYKNQLKSLGKEIDSIITIGTTELTSEQINSVSLHYEGNILKSVMKQLDLVLTEPLEKGTELNYKFGLDVNGSNEYLDYGQFIVKEVEKQEDTNTYKITCYDKMLYSMVDYEDMNLTYPITIKNYLQAICTKLGLTLKDDNFANQDNEIENELYLDSEGNSLGYTFRDVLDEIAQATGSTICINDNDELEVRYIDDAINETQEAEGTDLTLTDSEEGQIRGVSLKGDTYQYTTTGKNLFRNSDTFEGNASNGWVVGGTIDTIETKDDSYSVRTISAWAGPGANLKKLYEQGKIAIGDTLTYSIYFKTNFVPSGGIPFAFRLYRALSTGISVANIPYANITPGTWYRISTSFVVDSYSITSTNARIELDYYDRNDQYYFGNNRQNYVWFAQPQLEKSTTLTDYEKYTGGQASPSPTYPQSIDIVSGLQEVEIVGKNLFDINGTLYSGVITKYNNGFTLTNNGSYRVLCMLLPKTLPSGTYKFTSNIVNTTLSNINQLGIQVRTSSSNVKTFYINSTGEATFTTTSEADRMYFFINSSETSGATITLDNVMLSTSGGDYEPYKGKTYDINLGKQLFDLGQTLYDISATGTKLDNGVRETLPIQDGGYRYSYINIPNSSELLGKTITLSCKINKSVDTLVPNISLYGKTQTSVSTRYGYLTTTGKTTFTLPKQFPNGTTGLALLFYANVSGTGNVGSYVDYTDIQLEIGSEQTSYSEYFTPIELCKIGTYQDKIFKGKGTNIIGLDNQQYKVDLKTGDKITMRNNTPDSLNINLYTNYGDTTRNDFWSLSANTTRTITIAYDTKAIAWSYTPNGIAYANLGSTLLTYEPYNAKDKWLLHKETGKVVLNGSESWYLASTGNDYIEFGCSNIMVNGKSGYNYDISNYFKDLSNNRCLNNGSSCLIRTPDTTMTTNTSFKTWLNTHNTIVYYVLANPTTTEIDNSELVSQLNALSKAHTLDGTTNITSSFPLSLTYVSEFEVIDEELVKNTRASFDKTYSPINSLVLSRSADSDNIYIQDEDSIEENGLHELKIADNQILNGNNRDEYINEIFEKVNGLTYSYNDYESIGITYLDLCDRYKVKVRDNTYKCVMFNDEIEVNNGLNEIIYTDEAEESKTDYTKADKTDRRINQTYIIADKQQGQITALVNKTNNIDTEQKNNYQSLLAQLGNYATTSDVEAIQTEVEQIQTDSYTRTEIKQILKGTFYDEDNNQIVSEVVKTISGTFDENGMTYAKTNAKTSTTINESGVRVNNATSNQELLFAGYDDEINQTIVRADNMTTRNFLVVGEYSRFQDYEDGTGVFDL